MTQRKTDCNIKIHFFAESPGFPFPANLQTIDFILSVSERSLKQFSNRKQIPHTGL